MSNQRDFDYLNLDQTQNLLDLELNELRPILYPKFLNLMKNEKLNNDCLITHETKNAQSLMNIYIDENLITKNRSNNTNSLLDDRCIVGYTSNQACIICDLVFEHIKNRFYKKIRYSGKNYFEKLFNTLLDYSLRTGKTIIIDKVIEFERVGQNTQWKIDFTNFLSTNCNSSYDWLNHLKLSELRELGLLTLRNYLNQQMIQTHRSEINNRLQKEVQHHLSKANKENKANQTQIDQDIQIFKDMSTLNFKNLKNRFKKYSKEFFNGIDFLNFVADEKQINLRAQKIHNTIDELYCLQSSKFANHPLTLIDLSQSRSQNFNQKDKTETHQLTNTFKSNMIKQNRISDLNEIRDILEGERIDNNDLDESDEDEMITIPNYKQDKKNINKRHSKLKRFKRRLHQNFKYFTMYFIRFLQKQKFNILIKYEEIRNRPIIIKQFNIIDQELSSPLPPNVPYCQIGKSSIIAALKQFNWSHTQGPFLIND